MRSKGKCNNTRVSSFFGEGGGENFRFSVFQVVSTVLIKRLCNCPDFPCSSVLSI